MGVRRPLRLTVETTAIFRLALLRDTRLHGDYRHPSRERIVAFGAEDLRAPLTVSRRFPLTRGLEWAQLGMVREVIGWPEPETHR